MFCLGGDGTHGGVLELFKEIRNRKLKISIVGIPKTIDNDIAIIDESFGFETAVEVVFNFIFRKQSMQLVLHMLKPIVLNMELD